MHMWINNKWVEFDDEKFDNTTKEESEEAVNHPKHYNREGGMECIDEMILMFGLKAVMNFCKCNAWKYRYRAADKNGEEDLRKSDWYLNKYKELSNKFSQQGVDPWGTTN